MTDEHELVARGKQLAESGQYAPSTTAVNSNGHVAEDIPPEVVYPAEEISRPELVDNNISGWTAELLDDVDGFVGRFIVHPSEHERRAHVLWIAHAWLMDCWESTPRIAFLSPEPGSGKSRALEVTEPLVPRPVHTVNTTSAYLFRKVADPTGRPTILFDEIDTVFGPKAKEHEEIRGLINAGHRQGAQAGRCVVRGKEVFTEELEAYCAVALAGLDDLPDTIMTRSIVVRMRRRADDERVESWRPRLIKSEAQKLYTRLAKWSTAARKHLCGDFWWPDMPNGVEDRDADVWEALLAVADLAGERWAKEARVTAVTLVTAAKRRPPSIGVLLLRDIKKVFNGGQDKLVTGDLLAVLNAMDESPWATIRKGEPLDARGLAHRLGKYGIGSKPLRIGDEVVKGYSRAQFTDAWSRYVDSLIDDDGSACQESVTSVTSDTEQGLFATDVADVTGVTASGEPHPEQNGHLGAQFAPPSGPGRCDECGCHIATQGHKPDCPANTERPDQ